MDRGPVVFSAIHNTSPVEVHGVRRHFNVIAKDRYVLRMSSCNSSFEMDFLRPSGANVVSFDTAIIIL
jgi:hypothetical protein